MNNNEIYSTEQVEDSKDFSFADVLFDENNAEIRSCCVIERNRMTSL